MVGILINGRLATAEEREMLADSFVKHIFDSMTEQEKKDMADEFYEAIEEIQKRKDD